MKWKAIPSFVEGTSHKKLEIPCQDYGNYKIFNDVIVGAVADGAGSAKFSHIGAQLAVEKALLHLETWIIRLKQKKPNWQQPIPEELAKKVFSGTLKNVVNALKKKACENDYLFNDLACTLLIFVATPDWIAAMQIGDGFIVVRFEDSEYQLLFQPDKGEYANETNFVTSSSAQSEMRVVVLPGNQKFICASTDGLERLAISFRDWKPFAGFFSPFEEGLKITNNLKQEAKDIENWMASQEVNARTDDDKTMLLCLYDGDTQTINNLDKQLINSKDLNTELTTKQLSKPPLTTIIDSIKNFILP
ncbi:PP2C family serine/threonine-protein phosphatase [Nostoc sp. NMS8]|uniref:PP2C family serine/threonine-protein phosphatase n=1 Tax=Nostoc sp. NMS8 TaxID=2815392 RepID=UPI003459DF13|nr:protein phosphatase 2C domain-containing protein [Nostoc sp. NMS8]